MNEAIIQCWNNTKKSYVQIAEEFNLSIGVVAGVLNRAKQKGLITRFKKKKVRSVVVHLATPTEVPRLEDGKPVSIRNHQDWMCQMIVSKLDSPILYCCNAKTKKSYCAEHAGIVYQPLRRK